MINTDVPQIVVDIIDQSSWHTIMFACITNLASIQMLLGYYMEISRPGRSYHLLAEWDK